MQLPKSLAIEGIEYKVHLVPNLAATEQRFAEIDFVRQCINLEGNTKPDQQWESLLHEIIHAITQGEGIEENFVARTSRRLFGVLRANGLYPTGKVR